MSEKEGGPTAIIRFLAKGASARNARAFRKSRLEHSPFPLSLAPIFYGVPDECVLLNLRYNIETLLFLDLSLFALVDAQQRYYWRFRNNPFNISTFLERHLALKLSILPSFFDLRASLFPRARKIEVAIREPNLRILRRQEYNFSSENNRFGNPLSDSRPRVRYHGQVGHKIRREPFAFYADPKKHFALRAIDLHALFLRPRFFWSP